MAFHEFIQNHLSGMTERGMSQIVRQGNGLGEFFIQAKSARDGAGDLAHLYRVCQTRPVMIPLMIHKNLGLVFKPPERLRVDDPVAIALKGRPHVVLGLRMLPPETIGAMGGKRRQQILFPLLDGNPGVVHIFT